MSNKLKKSDKLKRLIQQHPLLFKCPVCQSNNMELNDNSLKCQNNHCFDLAKKGYVHLLMQSHKTIYDKELFTSRNYIYQLGIYEELYHELVYLIESHGKKTMRYVLDAGCGEGYFINKLANNSTLNKNCQFVGIDISKEGVAFATQQFDSQPVLWTVGDLSNLPFQDQTYDIILNILSPANYREFHRCLTSDGKLIKVIPGDEYLKEIRERLSGGFQSYSNQEVLRVFEEKVEILQVKRIRYKLPIAQEDLIHLFKMTPLTSQLTYQELKKLQRSGINQITIDLMVLVGKLKNK